MIPEQPESIHDGNRQSSTPQVGRWQYYETATKRRAGQLRLPSISALERTHLGAT